ncbi:hypothetical protein PoB_005670500 [Plakobranchus ocellatus]|uniref:Uncharacterized protein n=1 Tax=Plakobranchus ocellatus TaxID=259542 RepID=A0AAV4CER3_9GAST|nr:hypothetical protein PoB_005670500 [Plakobranchus ocellatus]
MSGACLGGGLYNHERRRSSFAVTQMTTQRNKDLNDVEEELAQLEACERIVHSNDKRSLPSTPLLARQISFSFERTSHVSGEKENSTTKGGRRSSCDARCSFSAETFASLPSDQAGISGQGSPEVRCIT